MEQASGEALPREAKVEKLWFLASVSLSLEEGRRAKHYDVIGTKLPCLRVPIGEWSLRSLFIGL